MVNICDKQLISRVKQTDRKKKTHKRDGFLINGNQLKLSNQIVFVLPVFLRILIGHSLMSFATGHSSVGP